MTTRRLFRRGRGRSTRPKQTTTWAQFALSFAMTAAAGPIVFFDLTPEPMRSSSTRGQATLLRAILSFNFSADANNVDPQLAAIGIYVLGHEAFDQTAFSDPLGDDQQSWYYWSFMTVSKVAGSAPQQHWEADIRTKRRLRSGYKLAVVTNNPLNDSATDLTMSARLLWALST